MNNCDELRKELAQTFAQLKAGEIKSSEAAELANLAGKMIGSAKVQVEYYALRKESPRIEWLESPNAKVSGERSDSAALPCSAAAGPEKG
jgi:hypothetical protein